MLLFRFFLFLAVFSSSSALAELLLDSKKISYDAAKEIISAEGGVIVKQEVSPGQQRELHCEKIEYNRKTGEIKLFGESVIKETTGEIIKAKNIQLDDKLKKAVINTLSLILKDNARIKADNGEKLDNLYTFKNASYSPCKEVNCSFPLWDLVAEKVVYDSQKKTFVYKNVRLRLKGATIFYTPYFSHPSFEVKRQSGFLAPIINSNSDTGIYAGIPYFFVIDKHRDFKLTPFINFKNRGFIAGEYRQVFSKSDFNINGSFLTKSNSKTEANEEKRNRWHVSTIFKSYNIDNKRFVLKINRASDITYMQKYPVNDSVHRAIIGRKCNESKIGLDLFNDNYFATVDSYVFQIEDKDIAPVILPHFNVNYQKPSVLNGIMTVESDTICLSRRHEVSPMFVKQFFRSSNKVNFSKTIHAKSILFDVNSGIKADIYEQNNDEKNKFFPVLENQLSAFYPLVSDLSQFKSVWGPKIALSSTESFNKRKKLQCNEDSVFSSFDDLNIHSLNRYGMYDRLEDGEKISTGIENSIYKSNGRLLNFFIGKSQTLNNKDKTRRNDRNVTVGRFMVNLSDAVSLRSRFVGVPLSSGLRMFESGVDTTLKQYSFKCSYIYDARINEFRKNGISQIGSVFGFKVNRYWKINYSQIINLRKKNGRRNLSQGIFANYEDECFAIGVGIYKSKYHDRDIKQNTGIVFSVAFKNLCALSKPVDSYLYKPIISNIN